MSSVDRSVAASRVPCRFHNRVAALMLHTDRYSTFGLQRLALDTGLSKSAITKVKSGKTRPLYSTFAKIVKCLEFQLGQSLPVDEVVSAQGSYPTKYVCQLVGCSGCTPDRFFAKGSWRTKAYRDFRAGQWTGDCAEFDHLRDGGEKASE
ncbi:MAG: hypothetical protein U0R49_11610 [Fimbriimonadales bacterium]